MPLVLSAGNTRWQVSSGVGSDLLVTKMGIHKHDKLYSFDTDNKTAVQCKMSSNDFFKKTIHSLSVSRV